MGWQLCGVRSVVGRYELLDFSFCGIIRYQFCYDVSVSLSTLTSMLKASASVSVEILYVSRVCHAHSFTIT